MKIYFYLGIMLILINCTRQNVVDSNPVPENLPNCNIHLEKNIFFSDFQNQDKLILEIIGEPCYTGTLKLNIIHKDTVVYHYQEKFKRHVASNSYDDNLDEVALLFANDLIEYSLKATNYFPKYLPPDEYYEKHYNQIMISEKEYNVLRSQNLPVFYHKTGYETWRYVVYSKNDNSSSIVIEGGL